MAEFDRKAATATALAELSTSEINRVTGLRVDGGPQFDSIMEEVRGAVETAFDERLSASEAVEQANIITGNDVDRLTYFTETQAAHSLTVDEVECDPSDSVLDFVAAALEHVYTEAVRELMEHVESAVDEAEREHVDEDEDDVEGLGGDADDWV